MKLSGTHAAVLIDGKVIVHPIQVVSHPSQAGPSLMQGPHSGGALSLRKGWEDRAKLP